MQGCHFYDIFFMISYFLMILIENKDFLMALSNMDIFAFVSKAKMKK